MKRSNLLLIILVFIISYRLSAQNIILDEDYSDWHKIQYSHEDTHGDGSKIDLETFKIHNDDQYIYFYLKMKEEILFQSDNDIVLYFDTDNNGSTGKKLNNIGADLVYKIGEREGVFYSSSGKAITVKQHLLGLVSSPTVSSNVFEFMFDKNAEADEEKIFPTEYLKIFIVDENNNGDQLPDSDGGLNYQFIENTYSSESYKISKISDNSTRVMTYNVLRDQLFKTESKDNYKRIFQAIKPDIIGLQEVYNHSAQNAENLIKEFLPNKTWYSHKLSNDNIYVGIYPVIDSYEIDGNSAFLLEITDSGKEMLFISAHPPCCNNELDRQKEMDHIMSFIRDAKAGSTQFTIEEKTPIVIVGDMNLVGFSDQQKTLTTGNIVNENIYGNSFKPDWDDTSLEDVNAKTIGVPASFTWYNTYSDFSPGRLDYIVYTGSVLNKTNSFVLFTPGMTQDSLAKHNLKYDDILQASDHLPVIADFELKTQTSIDNNSLGDINKYKLQQNYPNPFNPSTTIEYTLPKSGNVKLLITDPLGQLQTVLTDKFQSANTYEINFDGSRLSNGIYFYQLITDNFIQTKKMVLLK